MSELRVVDGIRFQYGIKFRVITSNFASSIQSTRYRDLSIGNAKLRVIALPIKNYNCCQATIVSPNSLFLFLFSIFILYSILRNTLYWLIK